MLEGTNPNLTANVEDVDFAVAASSFSHFLDFVKIVEPPQFATGFQGGPTSFVKWPHLDELAQILPSTRLVEILKAR